MKTNLGSGAINGRGFPLRFIENNKIGAHLSQVRFSRG